MAGSWPRSSRCYDPGDPALRGRHPPDPARVLYKPWLLHGTPLWSKLGARRASMRTAVGLLTWPPLWSQTRNFAFRASDQQGKDEQPRVFALAREAACRAQLEKEKAVFATARTVTEAMEALGRATQFHVTRLDEATAEAIRWARQAGAAPPDTTEPDPAIDPETYDNPNVQVAPWIPIRVVQHPAPGRGARGTGP